MGKKILAGLSFGNQKKIMQYIVPAIIIILLLVAWGDVMQKDLTYKGLNKTSGKIVYVNQSERHAYFTPSKLALNHIDLWIETQHDTLKYYAAVRHTVDAKLLTSKLKVGDTITVYTYSSLQKLLKPKSRKLVLAIQNEKEDILSLAEVKSRNRVGLYASLGGVVILLLISYWFWKVYVPKQTLKNE